MNDPARISARVSTATKEKLDRFAERRGLKRSFVVEQALLYFMEAGRDLPDEALLPSRLVLEDELPEEGDALLERGRAGNAADDAWRHPRTQYGLLCLGSVPMTDPRKGEEMTTHRRGVTCQISAFEVPNPPSDPNAPARKWMAIATAHVYDANVKVPGLQPGQEALAGETMRVFSGKAYADTEAQAMRAALESLLFQLTAAGFSANHDVKPW